MLIKKTVTGATEKKTILTLCVVRFTFIIGFSVVLSSRTQWFVRVRVFYSGPKVFVSWRRASLCPQADL